MAEISGRRVDRRQLLRITAVAGVSVALGGGLVRAVMQRARLKQVRETRSLMGTLVVITVVHPDRDAARQIMADTFDEMERLENLLSRHREGTPIWRLNQSGVVDAPPREVVGVIQSALEYSTLTVGAFDITVTPLIDVYESSYSERGVPPSDQDLSRALALVGSENVTVERGRITLDKPGMAVTLDGIAKGYIVDRAVGVLAEQGAERVLVDAGGDMSSAGESLLGGGWRIAIQDPRAPGRGLGVVELRGESIATSGDYMQYFTEDMSTHHIVDPRTGASPEHTSSVTIVTSSAMKADALATAVLVLGPEEGLSLIERLEDVEGMIVTKEQDVIVSKGLDRFLSSNSE